ncbi:MAG: (d)CMP kinase [SAR86 cluster bacterium]|uniref:Cytidylate kinase n=1 Tax=SAR86 cluster bacterium TaxID=2030880 RepID=A0A937I489_9GAMM|nr:(d)CMP kinase [SAR86 cluster bacterium]
MKLVENIITIDGPSGVGKGTLAFSLAKRLGWNVLDSGLLYRLVGYLSFKDGLETTQEIVQFLKKSKIKLITNLNESICEIELNDKILGKELRNENIASRASELAKEAEIRNTIIKIQRDAYDSEKGLIADGRDMGTIIFPEAALKVFLQASPEVRAERRANQLKEKGMSVIMHDILEQIQQRDEEDINRMISPLKPADDSLVIDTSNLSIKEVEEKVMENF